MTGIVHIATIDVYVVCRCDYMYDYAFDIEYLSIIRLPLSFISHQNHFPLFISVFECCYNCFLNSWEHCSYGAKSVFKHYIKFTAQSECVGWFWIAYTNCAQFLIFMEVEFSLSLSLLRGLSRSPPLSNSLIALIILRLKSHITIAPIYCVEICSNHESIQAFCDALSNGIYSREKNVIVFHLQWIPVANVHGDRHQKYTCWN